jgi:RNA polymerase sigma factor (TIGR02999 family)
MAGPDSVAQLMGRFRQGDREAAGHLVELFYPQLKQIAATKMRRESAPHTWQPTVLINELYLELVKIRALKAADSDEESEKTAFLNLSAHLMRRLLIHHARPLAKRVAREEFEEGLLNCIDGAESLHQIDNALDRLAEMDPNLRTVVELRVFEGLTGDETAERMACSPRSVARYWTFARNWLAQEFGAAEAT